MYDSTPAASINNALQTSLWLQCCASEPCGFMFCILLVFLPCHKYLLHQLRWLHSYCSELWKTLQGCGGFWCNSHQATCPSLLGKSFTPPLHTFLQLLPGSSSFAYFVELEIHAAHLNAWISYVYYHKPCECYTQCSTTTITVTPAITVHLLYCMEQYLCYR